MSLFRHYLFCLITLVPWIAKADPTHPLTEIYEAARLEALNFIEDNDIEVKIENTDPHLRLPLCTHALGKKGERPNGDRITIQVFCKEPAWLTHIPVRLERWKNVLYSNRSLMRGNLIQASDVHQKLTNTLSLHQGYFSNYEEIQHLEVAKPISTNQLIKPSQLAPIMVIRKGQLVQIQAIGNGIAVQTQGVALGNAHVGELVQVRNSRSGRIIEGTALKNGTVQIQL